MERKTTRSSTNPIAHERIALALGGARADVAGKIFVLGEYAVLSGAPALMAAVGPRFRLLPAKSPLEFHPASPAGRYLAAVPRIHGIFDDPLHGEGGWGGSTAEFALSVRLSGVRDVREAYRVYRELTARDSSPPPSGADLVVQWLGGAQWISEGFREFHDLSAVVSGFSWILFSATHVPGRKVRTHEHLARVGRNVLSMGTFAKLRLLIEEARALLFSEAAWGEREARELGRILVAYAEVLGQEGLECDAGREDRLALSALPGVAGAKGCGAMLSDSVLVLLADGSSETRARVRAAGEARGLKFHTSHLGGEPGIRCVEGARET